MNVKSKTATGSMLMAIKKITKQGITHPFGDHRSVKQAFPAGIPSKESDPFLMCDYFDMPDEGGKAEHDDDFPIGWHPHRGFDIASYLKTGVGRHGDSMGNREVFETPGMQWMSVGSGVEHAEGGANEKGAISQGFQIWINVPASNKMDDPEYGTVPNEDMPVVDSIGEKKEDGNGSRARVLAGDAFQGVAGPFRTKAKIQMVDIELDDNDTVEFEVGEGLDTAILYVYEGALEEMSGRSNDDEGLLDAGAIVLLDANSPDRRKFSLTTGADRKAGVMLFAGKKLKEPIAWHGPIVMNTQEQIYNTFREMRMGDFPPKRVDWDYKEWKSRPADWNSGAEL